MDPIARSNKIYVSGKNLEYQVSGRWARSDDDEEGVCATAWVPLDLLETELDPTQLDAKLDTFEDEIRPRRKKASAALRGAAPVEAEAQCEGSGL